MDILKKTHKRAGLIGTIVFHLVLILLFMIFGLSHMEPPPQQGILINFGNTDQGMGEVQPEQSSAAASEEDDVPQEESAAESSDTEEDVMTQDTEEAPAVSEEDEKKKEESEEEEKEEETEEQKVSEELNNLLNKWKAEGEESSEDSEGETGEPGDQGDPDGDPGSDSYQTGGNGTGTSYELSGRSMKSTPKIKDASQEEGKVVVDIIVDKYGNVVKARIGRGGTTSNAVLERKALEAAKKTRFNQKLDAPEEQKGKMTFVFILN